MRIFDDCVSSFRIQIVFAMALLSLCINHYIGTAPSHPKLLVIILNCRGRAEISEIVWDIGGFGGVLGGEMVVPIQKMLQNRLIRIRLLNLGE